MLPFKPLLRSTRPLNYWKVPKCFCSGLLLLVLLVPLSFAQTVLPPPQGVSQHTWDPQLNSPHWICICNSGTFIGDYFGNTSGGSTEYTTSVSTFDDGSNPNHYQQQVVASVLIPKP